jgi:hypothetical protein
MTTEQRNTTAGPEPMRLRLPTKKDTTPHKIDTMTLSTNSVKTLQRMVADAAEIRVLRQKNALLESTLQTTKTTMQAMKTTLHAMRAELALERAKNRALVVASENVVALEDIVASEERRMNSLVDTSSITSDATKLDRLMDLAVALQTRDLDDEELGFLWDEAPAVLVHHARHAEAYALGALQAFLDARDTGWRSRGLLGESDAIDGAAAGLDDHGDHDLDDLVDLDDQEGVTDLQEELDTLSLVRTDDSAIAVDATDIHLDERVIGLSHNDQLALARALLSTDELAKGSLAEEALRAVQRAFLAFLTREEAKAADPESDVLTLAELDLEELPATAVKDELADLVAHAITLPAEDRVRLLHLIVAQLPRGLKFRDVRLAFRAYEEAIEEEEAERLQQALHQQALHQQALHQQALHQQAQDLQAQEQARILTHLSVPNEDVRDPRNAISEEHAAWYARQNSLPTFRD